MTDGDRTVLKIGALLLLAVLLATANCATHSQSTLNASAAHELDTTTPVAPPKHFEFRGYLPAAGWSWLRPLIPTAGTRLMPPSVAPVPEPDAPDAGFSLAAPFYFEGSLDYGDPQPATTHETDGLQLQAEGEKDAQPKIPSLLGMLLGNWPYALLGVVAIAIIALVGFRKSGVVQRLAKFLPFPFSLLALAVPAPAETPKE